MIGIVGVLALWSADAEAQKSTVVRKICASMDTAYTSVAPRSDFWSSNGIRRFRGVRIELVDNATGNIAVSKYADDTGADRGCISASLNIAKQYTVTIFGDASVNGRRVYGKTDALLNYAPGHSPNLVCDPAVNSPCFPYEVVDTSYQTLGGNVEYVLEHDDLFGQVLVGTWMSVRSTFGVPLSADLVYSDSSCCTASLSSIMAQTSDKFTIAHETGHWLGTYLDEGVLPGADYSASMSGCNGASSAGSHNIFTREYQKAAFVEGFAYFVAAWTWNRSSESDCVYGRPVTFSYDYDLDGSGDSLFAQNQLGCEAAPWDLDADGVQDSFEPPGVASYVSAKDWLEDVRPPPGGSPFNSCTASGLTNYGTDYDWLRFFWDVHTDGNISVEDMFTLYDGANPRSMYLLGGGSSTAPNAAAQRVSDACWALGISTECTAAEDNGADH